MLIVSGHLSIFSSYRPPVLIVPHILYAQVYHRFDRNHHSFIELRTTSSSAEIRYLRILVQTLSKAMTYKLADNTVFILLLAVILNGKSNITNPVSSYRFFNAFLLATLWSP